MLGRNRYEDTANILAVEMRNFTGIEKQKYAVRNGFLTLAMNSFLPGVVILNCRPMNLRSAWKPGVVCAVSLKVAIGAAAGCGPASAGAG